MHRVFVVGLAMVAVGEDPRQHILSVSFTLLGGTRIPLLSDRPVGGAVLAIEIVVAQQALSEGLAGVCRHHQPFERKIGVTVDTPAMDETLADLGLRAYIACVCKSDPDGERAIPVAARGRCPCIN